MQGHSVNDIQLNFAAAQNDKDLQAGYFVEVSAFLLAAKLASEQGWSTVGGEAGMLRHASRIALSRHLDHGLWDLCRSCVSPDVSWCVVCGGSGNWFVSEAEFEAMLGERYQAVWAGRINEISSHIEKWAGE